MNRKIFFVVLFFSLLGLVIGTGIVYYLKKSPRETQSVAGSSRENSTEMVLRSNGGSLGKTATAFSCPCGSCSDKLLECRCPTADRVRDHLKSLIAKNLPEKEIINSMVHKFGRSIMGKKTRVPPYYEEVEGIEVPVTLDPESVLLSARAGYEVAKEYPQLLMQLPCFCGCDVDWGTRKAHGSLLDCYTDRHGENCRICVNEAVFAKKSFEEGRKPEEIRIDIIESHGRPTG